MDESVPKQPLVEPVLNLPKGGAETIRAIRTPGKIIKTRPHLDGCIQNADINPDNRFAPRLKIEA
jgi:hypothetical protein